MKVHEDYCINENRITTLENNHRANEARLNHYKKEVGEIHEDIDEIKEVQHQSRLAFTKSIDYIKVEIVEIHTTIKNVTLVLTILGGLITLILAVPEILALIP